MSDEQILLREIQKHIATRPDAKYVYARAAELAGIVEGWGEAGVLAFALLGAELAASS